MKKKQQKVRKDSESALQPSCCQPILSARTETWLAAGIICSSAMQSYTRGLFQTDAVSAGASPVGCIWRWGLKNIVSAVKWRPRSTSHPPPAASNKPGDDNDESFQKMAKAHSPSGSPHSVHCDSKQGPERDNRRLIEATHMWCVVEHVCSDKHLHLRPPCENINCYSRFCIPLS